MTEQTNISTEHQPRGSAGNPSDKLDKDAEKPRPADPDDVETSEDPGFALNGE